MTMTAFQREGLRLLGYTKREGEFLFLGVSRRLPIMVKRSERSSHTRRRAVGARPGCQREFEHPLCRNTMAYPKDRRGRKSGGCCAMRPRRQPLPCALGPSCRFVRSTRSAVARSRAFASAILTGARRRYPSSVQSEAGFNDTLCSTKLARRSSVI